MHTHKRLHGARFMKRFQLNQDCKANMRMRTELTFNKNAGPLVDHLQQFPDSVSALS